MDVCGCVFERLFSLTVNGCKMRTVLCDGAERENNGIVQR